MLGLKGASLWNCCSNSARSAPRIFFAALCIKTKIMSSKVEIAIDASKVDIAINEENKKLKAQLDTLLKEKDILMSVAAGNYKYEEEFKEICKEYFSEALIEDAKKCPDGWGMVGEYFYEEYSGFDHSDMVVNIV